MPTLKPGTILPSNAEDATISAGIAAGPDTYELSSEEFAILKPGPVCCANQAAHHQVIGGRSRRVQGSRRG